MHTYRRARLALALVLFAAPLAVACADDGPEAEPSDFVEIVMRDFDFTPARVVIPAGQEVTFRFRNEGAVTHEAVFGDAADSPPGGPPVRDPAPHRA